MHDGGEVACRTTTEKGQEKGQVIKGATKTQIERMDSRELEDTVIRVTNRATTKSSPPAPSTILQVPGPKSPRRYGVLQPTVINGTWKGEYACGGGSLCGSGTRLSSQ